MKLNEAISKRIYELCDKYNYSPNKLAVKSGIPPTNLRQVLAQKVENPSSLLIYKICKEFKIELKEFYNSPLFDNLSD